MPEPFKLAFNRDLVVTMGEVLRRHWPAFDSASFVAMACARLDALELKQRSDAIASALEQFLPQDFAAKAQLLVAALHPDTAKEGEFVVPGSLQGMRGWAVMPMAEVIARHGAAHHGLAMDALKEMTKRFSAEFAIRPFVRDQTVPTLNVLQRWLDDPSEHVRRLVSEGTRPRLPWGLRLQCFVDDPAPLLPLLEALRDDPSEYVRRSVANNLNDIAKDHPDLVVKVASAWLREATPARQRLVRHALRTLVKQGNTGALALLGCAPITMTRAVLDIETPIVRLGEKLRFSLDLLPDCDGQAMLDYRVYHVKANGTRAPKVFKWTRAALTGGKQWRSHRDHPIRPVTTRRYYGGDHLLEIVINGLPVAKAPFRLIV